MGETLAAGHSDKAADRLMFRSGWVPKSLKGILAGAALLAGLAPSMAPAATLSFEQLRAMETPPSSFGLKTCQQLWYLEQKVLAAGRICLGSERGRRAFSASLPCISDDEKILEEEVRLYLDEVRMARREKRCPAG
ncbi:hypothetical protein [Roseibium sp.]|uniref:hypothetical protein n=1 Tax=Roseibium sp. TaxID=1936156 RepID=UPI003A972950